MAATKEEKRLIEAALFISSRPMALEELRTLTGIGALGYLQNVVNELKGEYESRGSAVEVIGIDGKFVMRIRNQYVDRVKQFAQDTEISKPALRTLAYISRHDGALKSELAKRIGSQVYDDVRELVENGFVRPQKSGRSSKLFLTEKFNKYFEKGAAIAPAAAAAPAAKQAAPQQTLDSVAMPEVAGEPDEGSEDME